MIAIGILLTLLTYKAAVFLKGTRFFNKIPPIIISGAVIIIILKMFDISYLEYNKSASFFTFLLGPATIALAYPLIQNIQMLKKNKRATWFGLVFATIVAIISTFVLGKFFHADFNIIMSMIPKSVTTPIAVEISKSLGGIPELTACIVILTGIVGSLFGHKLLEFFKIKHDVSIGLSIGASSHVMGTARCIEKKQTKQAAISTLALIIVGIFTAIVAPVLVSFFIQ